MQLAVISITQEEAISYLTDAIETKSIQYWACDYGPIKIWRDKELNIVRAELEAQNKDGEKQTYKLDDKVIERGILKLFETGFEVRKDILDSIVKDDIDSDGYDCIIQAALFGELIYG